MLLVLFAIIFVISTIFMMRNRMLRKPENTLSERTKRRHALKEQRRIKNMILKARLIAMEKANNPDIEDFELPDGFPMKTMDEFEKFEEDTDKRREKSLRDYLKFTGRQNLREALHNFVRVAVTEELAEAFTWTGRSGANAPLKKKFKGTKMMKIFMSAAKRIKKIQKFTLDEFSTNFTKVLRSYKQISKAAKKKKANQRQNEEQAYLLSDDEDDKEMD